MNILENIASILQDIKWFVLPKESTTNDVNSVIKNIIHLAKPHIRHKANIKVDLKAVGSNI